MSTANLLGPTPRVNFKIKLTLERDGRFLVRLVQVGLDEISHRYEFALGRPIEQTLLPEFVSSFSDELGYFLKDRKAVCNPLYSFSMLGVGVSGLNIDSADDGDDFDGITLNFRRFVGDLTRVLLFEQTLDVSTASVRERIAVDVLSDIISPIFDMLSLSRNGGRSCVTTHSAAIQARLDQLNTQQEEMEFYVGLLKRYVAGCQHDAAASSSAAPAPPSGLERRTG
ncbi:MAG: hypothetical protein ABJN34_09495 [Litoreibacter sp.]|uniref:hypothetical protein n=1 Tax=Litoreibacter sp. TaxID=1969459 RepID=UPI003296CBE1